MQAAVQSVAQQNVQEHTWPRRSKNVEFAAIWFRLLVIPCGLRSPNERDFSYS